MKLRHVRMALPARLRPTAERDARRIVQGIADALTDYRSGAAQEGPVQVDRLRVVVAGGGRPAPALAWSAGRAAVSALEVRPSVSAAPSAKPGRR